MSPVGYGVLRTIYRQTEVRKLESNLKKFGKIGFIKYIDV